MPFDAKLSLEGIQEVQQRNLRRIAALKPEGAAGQAVRDAIISLHRYATQITHVGKYAGGGALKNSHRMELDGLEGKVYIDPASVSPRRGQGKKAKPVEYGIYEEARGGEHAFYGRTVAEAGPAVSQRVTDKIREAVLYGK
jgi:hypothetical protein